MSRPLLTLIAVIVVLVGLTVLLSTLDTEVRPGRVEKPVANDAAAG